MVFTEFCSIIVLVKYNNGIGNDIKIRFFNEVYCVNYHDLFLTILETCGRNAIDDDCNQTDSGS